MTSNRQNLYRLASYLYNSGNGSVRNQQSEPPQRTDSKDTLDRKFAELLVYNTGATVLNQLKAWTVTSAFSIASAATYDSDNLLVSAAVTWPDGSAGSYTRVVKNGSFPVTDSFRITHADSGLTFTQPTVTRDGSGRVTLSPPIEVTETSGTPFWWQWGGFWWLSAVL